jgi:hypothetical protein
LEAGSSIVPLFSSRSRSVAATLLAAAAAIFAPARASAQSCCAGATALTPARLAPHEDAVMGLQVRAVNIYGSLDAGGRYVEPSPGAVEIGFEQSLLAVARISGRLQASMSLPFVETFRSVPGLSEVGGGLGDMTYGLRYDFIEPGRSLTVPGIAMLGNLMVPTGTPPEMASSALASDATGVGAAQVGVGLSFEHEIGHAVVNLTGSATWRAPRHIGEIRVQDGIGLLASGAGGYVFDSGAALLLTVAYAVDLPAQREGASNDGGGRARTRVGLAGGHEVWSSVRLQGSVFADLPVPHMGFAEPLGVGLSLAVLRAWM